MSRVYLTYANVVQGQLSRERHARYLEHLKDEQRAVKRALEDFDNNRTIHYDDAPFATIDKDIVPWLEDREKSKALTVFSFSGHAGGGNLMFEDDEGRCEGLANYLAKAYCPNLKLVFLNGCLTYRCLSYFENNNVPIIISTNTSVGDEKAKKFATAFFRHLGQGFTIYEAFNRALSEVQIKVTAEKNERHYRGVGRRENPKDKLPEWQISYREERFKNWKLLMGFADPPDPDAKSDLFDIKEPNVDYAVVSCDRSEQWRTWLDFWDTHHENEPFLQFFLEAETIHRPESFVERFKRYIESEYGKRVNYIPVERNGTDKYPGMGARVGFPNPKKLLDNLLRGSGGQDGQDSVFLLYFDIDVGACTHKKLKQWQEMIAGDWLKEVDGFNHRLLIFYRMWIRPTPKRRFRFWKKKSAAEKTRDEIFNKASSAGCTHIWTKDWGDVSIEDLRRWGEEYTTKLDWLEECVKSKFGENPTMSMSKAESFLRNFIQGNLKTNT